MGDYSKLQALMNQCQRGVPGSGRSIEAANNLLADCYGSIGAMLAEIDRLKSDKTEPCDGCFMEDAEALRKDAERLSWLDESREVESVGPTLCCGKHRPTLREAIDAAMAMEAGR